jgi:hypothetical protein
VEEAQRGVAVGTWREQEHREQRAERGELVEQVRHVREPAIAGIQSRTVEEALQLVGTEGGGGVGLQGARESRRPACDLHLRARPQEDEADQPCATEHVDEEMQQDADEYRPRRDAKGHQIEWLGAAQDGLQAQVDVEQDGLVEYQQGDEVVKDPQADWKG